MTRYHLGRFGVDSLRDALKVAVGAPLLLGLASRVLARIGGLRGLLGPATRTWATLTRRFLGIRLETHGAVGTSGPCIVVALHEGFADALVLLSLGLELRFLARDELFSWPDLGRYLRATGQIEVPTGPDLASLRRLYRDVGDAFAAGDSVVVFPQGSILGLELAFTDGAFRLADRFDVPVLPVVITGTHQVWEHPFSDRLRFGCTVQATVLPLQPAGSARATARELERHMKRIAKMSDTAPARRYEPDRDGYWDGYTFEIDPDYPRVAKLVAAHRGERGS